MHSVFGNAIDCGSARMKRRRWLPLQPVTTVMAPCGHLHFHPQSPYYRDDFSQEELGLQGLFIHEMTHVWQTQHRGRWYLPLMRHPFCRYDYTLQPGRRLEHYGIEQQAEIVRHAFLLSHGVPAPGAGTLETYRSILQFK